MGRHTRPTRLDTLTAQRRDENAALGAAPCPEHDNGVHYYASDGYSWSKCACGHYIRANNDGHH
jgi:hypothetical protein